MPGYKLIRNMADSHGLLSSPKLINVEFENVDINSIKLLKDQADLVYDGTRVIWTRDLPSLEKFVENILGLTGKWKSSGGKAKQFINSNLDLIITWYPGKLNSLTFNGKKAETFKNFLVSVLSTNSVKLINTDTDCLSQLTADKSTITKSQSGCIGLNQDQIILDAAGEALINKDTAKPDCSTLDELQDFIEQSFQNCSILKSDINLSFADQTIDSSTPFRSQVDVKSAIMEEQFCIFKEKIELEIEVLITKLSDQTQIINESKQEICKLVSENLNLKSRLAELEEKVFPRNQSNTIVGPSEKNYVNSNSAVNNSQPDTTNNDNQLKAVGGSLPSISHPVVINEVTPSEVINIDNHLRTAGGSLPGISQPVVINEVTPSEVTGGFSDQEKNQNQPIPIRITHRRLPRTKKKSIRKYKNDSRNRRFYNVNHANRYNRGSHVFMFEAENCEQSKVGELSHEGRNLNILSATSNTEQLHKSTSTNVNKKSPKNSGNKAEGTLNATPNVLNSKETFQIPVRISHRPAKKQASSRTVRRIRNRNNARETEQSFFPQRGKYCRPPLWKEHLDLVTQLTTLV
jgi:hypothetical protein